MFIAHSVTQIHVSSNRAMTSDVSDDSELRACLLDRSPYNMLVSKDEGTLTALVMILTFNSK